MREFLDLWKALTYAFTKHGNKRRISGNVPYIIHPIRVAMILRAAGFSEFKDSNLIIAALFHDLLEDTDVSFEDLKQEYGNQLALIVKELSKPEESKKDDWLNSFGSASGEAKIIKIADRIDNLLDMKSTGWSVEKQKEYAKQGLIILEKCGDANPELAMKLKETIDQVLMNL